jgi:transcriptional regulator of aromatic amino acid metabolism
VQRELVRTLQDHKHRYRQLGSNEEKTSEFELVCASNQSFDELRSQLYPDFLDRIAHLIVEIPPLRLCRVLHWILIRDVTNIPLILERAFQVGGSIYLSSCGSDLEVV